MTDRATPIDLATLSDNLADAVERAAAWTVTVRARPGLGATGIALAADLVVTADHVVDPRFEDNLRLRLPDGTETAATLAGRDPASDLAVLRLAGGGLTPATAAAGPPRTGSLAVAIGRPRAAPFASLALIAGSGGPARTQRGGLLDRYYLVDAVLYPGFSGGPLVDSSGGVLGLNTSGLALDGPDVALPWEVVAGLAHLIAEHGAVPRGYLGIGTQPVALAAPVRALAGGQERGLLVVQVVEDGPAAAAGVLQGDIIVRLDGVPVATADDLQGHLGPGRAGRPISAAIIRGGATLDLPMTIGRRH